MFLPDSQEFVAACIAQRNTLVSESKGFDPDNVASLGFRTESDFQWSLFDLQSVRSKGLQPWFIWFNFLLREEQTYPRKHIELREGNVFLWYSSPISSSHIVFVICFDDIPYSSGRIHVCMADAHKSKVLLNQTINQLRFGVQYHITNICVARLTCGRTRWALGAQMIGLPQSVNI